MSTTATMKRFQFTLPTANPSCGTQGRVVVEQLKEVSRANEAQSPNSVDNVEIQIDGKGNGSTPDFGIIRNLADLHDVSNCSTDGSAQEEKRRGKRFQHLQLSSARVLPLLGSPSSSTSAGGNSASLERQQGSVGSASIGGAGYALEGVRFISRTTGHGDQKQQLWETVEKRFQKLACHGVLSRPNFAACIGMEDSAAFAGELFDALARSKGEDRCEYISLEDLHNYWTQINDDSFHSRVQIFFHLCDKDSDGRIAEEEVKEVILLSALCNKLSIVEDQAEEYAALIMDELDADKLGYIELSQLESLFRAAAEGTFDNNSGLLNQPPPPALAVMRCRGRRMMKQWMNRRVILLLIEQWQRVWILLVWFAAMAGLFAWKFSQYKRRDDFEIMGYCVCTAKGAAETLKLNMALILFPMCRNSITWLRSTFLSSFVPFDDNIRFHKILGGAIGVGVAVHASSHLGCDFPRIASADHLTFMETIASDFDYQQPSLRQIVLTVEVMTGMVMVVLMCVAYLLANHSFRRNLVKLPWPFHRLTGFNAFWYSHHLFLLVYAILIVHSLYLFLAHDWTQKTTWVYIAVPMILYTGERFLRIFRSRQHKVNSVKAAIYAGDVLALYMTKPSGFKYRSGMYIFLQCPVISPFEWHPFSITSAPDDPYLSVHIRSVGDWTQEMWRIFKEVLEYSQKKILRTHDGKGQDPRFPKLFIDGPYGAPAQSYRKYEVMLLVGVGIGATPFVSVVKDVLSLTKFPDVNLDSPPDSSNSIDRGPSDCSSPSNINSPTSPLSSGLSPRKRKRPRPPTKAYFYWITREQRSFEWFKGIMNEVAEADPSAVIEMHNYLTSVYEEGDVRSALITLVQALHHAKNGVDILSGTRVRTHFARPKWQKVFSRLAAKHVGARIGVFYCGPAALAKDLDALSRKFSQTSSAKFVFHKENF